MPVAAAGAAATRAVIGSAGGRRLIASRRRVTLLVIPARRIAMATEANNDIAPGTLAPDFQLPDRNPLTGDVGRLVSRDAVCGKHGLLVMFICNHCPYVVAIHRRLVGDCRELIAMGFGVVAISANDAASYPQDGPERMSEMARDAGFPFPYLYDESQSVARAYGAMCTPDFFGFDGQMRLCYRGRLDAAVRKPRESGQARELVEALRQVAATGKGPAVQHPSIGCSIKWR